jgi:hypothetical protein
MHVQSHAAANQPTPQSTLAKRLISLADDTDRAGLRREAAMILAMAYSVLDGDNVEDWRAN